MMPHVHIAHAMAEVGDAKPIAGVVAFLLLVATLELVLDQAAEVAWRKRVADLLELCCRELGQFTEQLGLHEPSQVLNR